MKISDVLSREIGKVKDPENLLLGALANLLSYAFIKKGGGSKKRKGGRGDYTIQDAFNDTFTGSRLKERSVRMVITPK